MDATQVDAVGPDDPEEIFRARLRQRRVILGWSQQNLTDEMVKQGYPWHQTTVAKVEAGQRRLSLGEATALARVLGGNLDDMATESVADMDDRLVDLRLRERTLLQARLIEIETRLAAAQDHESAAAAAVEVAMVRRERARHVALDLMKEHAATGRAITELDRLLDEVERVRAPKSEDHRTWTRADKALAQPSEDEIERPWSEEEKRARLAKIERERAQLKLELAKINADKARGHGPAQPRHGSR